MKICQYQMQNTTIKTLSLTELPLELNKTQNFYLLDEKVSQIYEKELTALPNNLGIFLIDAKENNKTLATYDAIINELLIKKITKDTTIVAIGGGITSDIAGFLAATYKRGLSLIIVPTTLTCMIDASIGGKCGLNHGLIKNAIGVFKQPEKILICSAFLKTLDDVDLLSGKCEMLKLALISNSELLQLLKEPIDDVILEKWAYQKALICMRDEYNLNVRHLLNFGHTLAHAFELTLNIKHGIAVGIGMSLITKDLKLKKTIDQYLLSIGLDISQYLPQIKSLDKNEILNLILNDKKNQKMVNIIRLTSIGHAHMESLTIEKFSEELYELLS